VRAHKPYRARTLVVTLLASPAIEPAAPQDAPTSAVPAFEVATVKAIDANAPHTVGVNP
jgi:hypothetical protein